MVSERVQFFKLGSGMTVGKILIDVLAPCEGADDFYKMARSALMTHRGDNRAPEWPEAVRLVSADGEELFRWTVWDEHHAKQRELQAEHQKYMEARRSS